MGFTLGEIDSVLAPYAEKSFKNYYNEYINIIKESSILDTEIDIKRAQKWALSKVEKDIEQGFQGFEHTFNTVASSRGDYPFVTMTGGCEESVFGQLVWKTALRVRREGQGHPNKKRPAIFPKLVFLYTKELHSKGKKLYNLFLEGVKTSAVAMYPDWLSLDMPDENVIYDVNNRCHFEPSIAKIFKKYHKFGPENSRWKLGDDGMVHENPNWIDSIISPMGCRAYLSPIYQSGKLTPVDENDKPVFQGRFNGGAISLNLPMILRKSQLEHKDFYEVLDHYLEMINQIHIKTYDFLCKLKASCNPVAFCEGGFANLKPTDSIKSCVDKITFSYGFTALNELQQLYNGHSLYEEKDNFDSFAYEVLQYINNYVENKKREREEGKVPYIAAIYGTPRQTWAA